jgi:hypothetical protein
MKYDVGMDVQCAYEAEGAKNTPPEQLRPFFETKSVSGRPLTTRYVETIFSGFSTTRLFLVTVVHVVGIPSETGGFKPIVNQAWIDTLFRVANDIWSQACIKLVPYSTGGLVTNFRDISVSGFLGFCLAAGQEELVQPHDITAPGTLIINVYLVEDTNGPACGSPITGHIIMPTAGRGPEFMGRVFAHEIGHVLLNPLGVDDSEHPDHLMFHPDIHPEIPPGSRDGLFLSDCIGAQTRAREDLFAFARPGGPLSTSEPVACRMNPRLGNNLVIVATNPTLAHAEREPAQPDATHSKEERGS